MIKKYKKSLLSLWLAMSGLYACSDVTYQSLESNVKAESSENIVVKDQVIDEGQSEDATEEVVPPTNVHGGYLYCSAEAMANDNASFSCDFESMDPANPNPSNVSWSARASTDTAMSIGISTSGASAQISVRGQNLTAAVVNAIEVAASVNGNTYYERVDMAIEAKGGESMAELAAQNGDALTGEFQFYKVSFQSISQSQSSNLTMLKIKVDFGEGYCQDQFTTYKGSLCGRAAEVSASSEVKNGTRHPVWKAFDNTTSRWHTRENSFDNFAPYNGDEWAQIAFDAPVKIMRFGLRGCDTNSNCGADRSPDRFSILGSNDGINWYGLYYYDGSSIGSGFFRAVLSMP